MPRKPFTLGGEFPAPTYEQWRQQVETDLKGAPFEKKLLTHTYEGITIQPLYTERDWPASKDPAGFPGVDPFTRGSQPLGTARGWDIRQEQAHPSAAENNRAIRTDLEKGATSVRIRMDDAVRLGLFDAAAERVGVGGMILAMVDDLETALEGVDLDQTRVGLDAGAAFLPAAAMLDEVWTRRGVAAAQGAFNADPLGTLAETGRLPYSIEAGLAQLADLASWTAAHRPGTTSVQVGTTPYHHAGATATQDLAFSMATGVTYLRELLEGGMDVDTACGQIVFNYSVGCNFFLAIAKLRAARRLWARIAEACGASESARGMRMHSMASRRVLTERDPWVNMLRVTVCTAAGAIGGAQAISAAPFDLAIGPPDDFSRRLARNTQVILAEESHLGRVVDPAGGSWYVEKLTDQLAEAGWKMFQQIEERGGMVKSLVDGWAAEQIHEAFAQRLQNLRRRRDPITGVSEYPNIKEKPVVRKPADLVSLRRSLQERLVTRRLEKPEPVAFAHEAEEHTRGGERMAAAVEMARAGWPLPDMLAQLAANSEPLMIERLQAHPFSEPFEALRRASDEALERHGRRPAVFLANLGPVARHTARANYAQNFFEAGGFEVISTPGFSSPAAAAEAFAGSKAAIAVICSDDKLYQEQAAETAGALKAAGARTVVLAGNPGDNRESWQQAGIDRFIHIGSDVLEILRALLEQEGVLQ